ncbi:MAG: mechanosensitive ion channel family protein [Oscillospiraceae bacterium]|nr:mechanosensitive ion channel family protein [Oscillospiraceae bacterium]
MELMLTAVTDEEISSFSKFLHSMTWDKVVPVVIILAVSLVLIKLFTMAFNKAIAHSKLDETLRPLCRTAFKTLLISIAILISAGTLGLDVSALVAILSVASLAISLALQDFLANMVGGLVILTAHPFRIGDYVDISGTAGTVRRIGLTYTDLRTPGNQDVHVPNRQVSDSTVINFTAAGTRRFEITVSVSYDAETEAVKAALLRTCEREGILADPAPEAHLSGYGDSAVQYVLRGWTTAERYWEVYYAVLESIKPTLREAGMSMTYPQLNVHLLDS